MFRPPYKRVALVSEPEHWAFSGIVRVSEGETISKGNVPQADAFILGVLDVEEDGRTMR